MSLRSLLPPSDCGRHHAPPIGSRAVCPPSGGSLPVLRTTPTSRVHRLTGRTVARRLDDSTGPLRSAVRPHHLPAEAVPGSAVGAQAVDHRAAGVSDRAARIHRRVAARSEVTGNDRAGSKRAHWASGGRANVAHADSQQERDDRGQGETFRQCHGQRPPPVVVRSTILQPWRVIHGTDEVAANEALRRHDTDSRRARE